MIGIVAGFTILGVLFCLLLIDSKDLWSIESRRDPEPRSRGNQMHDTGHHKEGDQCPECLKCVTLRMGQPGRLFDAGMGTVGLRCTRCGFAYQGGAQGDMSVERWRSVAVWPQKIQVGDRVGVNESSDTHATRSAAEAVCRLLERHGYGGDGKVFPTSTRVEPVEQD